MEASTQDLGKGNFVLKSDAQIESTHLQSQLRSMKQQLKDLSVIAICLLALSGEPLRAREKFLKQRQSSHGRLDVEFDAVRQSAFDTFYLSKHSLYIVK